jgi:hypothetical protein
MTGEHFAGAIFDDRRTFRQRTIAKRSISDNAHLLWTHFSMVGVVLAGVLFNDRRTTTGRIQYSREFVSTLSTEL